MKKFVIPTMSSKIDKLIGNCVTSLVQSQNGETKSELHQLSKEKETPTNLLCQSSRSRTSCNNQ